MSKNQQGFTVIEGLLIFVILIIIGGTGWYVWHSQNQANNTYSQTTNSTAAPKSTSSDKNTSTGSNKGYIVIKEWNVRAKYTGALTLTYSYDAKNQKANFNSAQLKATDPSQCTDGVDSGGYIIRYAPSDHVYTSDEGADMGTADKYFTGGPTDNYKYLGNHYYFYIHPQAACSEKVDLGYQTDDAVKALVQNLETMPK
jgi:hypothetical protein